MNKQTKSLRRLTEFLTNPIPQKFRERHELEDLSLLDEQAQQWIYFSPFEQTKGASTHTSKEQPAPQRANQAPNINEQRSANNPAPNPGKPSPDPNREPAVTNNSSKPHQPLTGNQDQPKQKTAPQPQGQLPNHALLEALTASFGKTGSAKIKNTAKGAQTTTLGQQHPQTTMTKSPAPRSAQSPNTTSAPALTQTSTKTERPTTANHPWQESSASVQNPRIETAKNDPSPQDHDLLPSANNAGAPLMAALTQPKPATLEAPINQHRQTQPQHSNPTTNKTGAPSVLMPGQGTKTLLEMQQPQQQNLQKSVHPQTNPAQSASDLADLINQELSEQARRHGVDLS